MPILDELVIPFNNGYVRDGATYQNVTLQDQCPLRIVEHARYVLDGTIYDGIRDALRGQSVDLNCFAVWARQYLPVLPAEAIGFLGGGDPLQAAGSRCCDPANVEAASGSSAGLARLK